MDMNSLANAWRRRAEASSAAREEAARRARVAAREAARVLRERFDASAVWLFGSLRGTPRHDDFDVDLAVEGLPAERYFEALAAAADIVGREVDLVPLETSRESLCRRVRETGVRLDE